MSRIPVRTPATDRRLGAHREPVGQCANTSVAGTAPPTFKLPSMPKPPNVPAAVSTSPVKVRHTAVTNQNQQSTVGKAGHARMLSASTPARQAPRSASDIRSTATRNASLDSTTTPKRVGRTQQPSLTASQSTRTPLSRRPQTSSTATTTPKRSAPMESSLSRSKSSTALRDHIAKARAAMKSGHMQAGAGISASELGSSRGPAYSLAANHDEDPSPVDDLYASVSDPFNQAKFERSISAPLKQAIEFAKLSGRLNCADMSLCDIPDEVYTMYRADVSTTIDFSSDGPQWYDYVDLEHFCAADNEISLLDDRLADNFGGLISVDLHHNRLQELPESLVSLQRLAVLNLAGNELSADALSLVLQIPTLIELDMSANLIVGQLLLPEKLPAGLQSLSLSRNNLSELSSAALASSTSIRHLRLADCRLEHFDLTHLPVSLITLDLSRNRLRSIVVDGRVRDLQELYLANNHLEAMSIEPGTALAALRRLDASTNRLKTLSDTLFDGLSGLEFLDLSQNSLEVLPISIGKLAHLRHLNIAGNDLAELEPRLGRLGALQHLEWRGNRLNRRYASTTDTVALLARLRLEDTGA